MLTKGDIQVLKQVSQPSAMTEQTLGLWLLILDSFGIELHTKSKAIISEGLLQIGKPKAKAKKYAALGIWTAV